MFLCNIALQDISHTLSLFNGRIGTWLFVTKQAAQRISKNRRVGTMELKLIIVS